MRLLSFSYRNLNTETLLSVMAKCDSGEDEKKNDQKKKKIQIPQ